jgi:ribosomal protein L11 methylase PrmA
MNKLPSSFRDSDGFLYQEDDTLYRCINQSYSANYEMLISSGLYDDLVKKGLLISHVETNKSKPGGYKIIEPKKLNFISYPYEWSFSQLRDAALLTLQIQKRALDKGQSLKDASAYNIQFTKGKAIFIDTLSFEVYEEGKPWVAYKQFCQHFLAPLALASHVDIRCLHLLRSYIDGIPLDLAATLLPGKTKFNFSLLTHIHLHAHAQIKYAGKAKKQTGKGRVSKMGMLGLIDHLTTAIKKLKWQPKGTEWGNYYSFTNYSETGFETKKSLVQSFIKKIKPATFWDIGANDGTFSKLAANKGIETLAFDIDPIAVEKNYLRNKESDNLDMLPLLMDFTNPSTNLGWAQEERSGLKERGKTGCLMALALIHHISISNNVPLGSVAKFFCTLSNYLIIEFVPKEDSQVQKLLTTRKDIFPNYHKEGFEQSFSEFYEIVEQHHIAETLRTLYLMKAKV